MKKILLSMAVVASAMLVACSGNSDKAGTAANSTAAESVDGDGVIDVVEDVIYNPDSTVTPESPALVDPEAAASEAAGKAEAAASTAAATAKDRAAQLYGDVKEGVEKGYDAAKNGAKEGYDATKKTVKEGYDATKKGVKEGYEATKEKVGQLSGDVKDEAEKGVNALKNL